MDMRFRLEVYWVLQNGYTARRHFTCDSTLNLEPTISGQAIGKVRSKFKGVS